MKKFFSLFLAVLLIFSCWTAATAESTDAVSGAPLDNDIEICLLYTSDAADDATAV